MAVPAAQKAKTVVLSEFKTRMAERFAGELMVKEAEAMTESVLDCMREYLLKQDRIEIRGFGSWRVKFMRPRVAHNPRSRQKLVTTGSFKVAFKPGGKLRKVVNDSRHIPLGEMTEAESMAEEVAV